MTKNEMKKLLDLVAKLTAKIANADAGSNAGAIMHEAWPTTQGPSDGAHAWTRNVVFNMPTTSHNPSELTRSAMMFESARGVLTYREISDLFGNVFTAAYINLLARKNNIARHCNPTIHKGKTFRTRFAS